MRKEIAMDDTHTAPRKRIDLAQESDCRYWTEKLGVSREQLERAIAAVGDDPAEVHRYIAEGPGNTDPSGASHWRATSGL
jgi:hypothetical protein